MSQEKCQFKFVLIRFVPDFVRDEFFNAGIIFYDMTHQAILGRVAEKPLFLKCFDSKNYRYFVDYANRLVDSLRNIPRNEKLKDMLDNAFKTCTTPNAGLVSFSNVKGGITDDIHKEFDYLYKRFVTEESAQEKPDKKPKRDIAVIRVYQVLNKLSDRLKKQPAESIFEHELIEGGYKFEVSFNKKDNLHLKVLSLRSRENRAHELQNILSAIPILTDLKKEHKGHTFGGLIYFSPKYNKHAQEDEFGRLKERFQRDGLDCVRGEEKELLNYFSGKNLAC